LTDFHEVMVLDCVEENIFPANPQNPKVQERIKGVKFERLRMKSKYFTKEYDENFNLLSVDPFFIDVRIAALPALSKFIEQYEIKKTGAIVRIYLDERGTHYIYTLRIPEMQIKISDVVKIYDSVEEFKNSGEVSDGMVKRWYLDYGILEHLLFDENILEININPPAYKTSMRIVHSKYQECTSNIYASDDFLNYVLTRLKISTGRPVNKVSPQIDGEILIEGSKARVAGIISQFLVQDFQ
jgi:hypothetical protein